MMLRSTGTLVLFEIFILLPTSSSIQKRREALINVLKQIEEECVAVVSKRMKSVKIYFDRPPKKIVEALLCSNRRATDDLVNLRANKKNIIVKKKNGSMYIGDPYLHQTTERYLELQARRNIRRLALMKYNHVTDDIFQIDGHKEIINVMVDADYSLPAISPSVKYPLFSNSETRLHTYRSWRSNLHPQSLAENGFFYQGVGDTTTCYSCGVALKHWNPDDDALLEHLRYSPTCNHLENLLGKKTIQEYLKDNSLDLTEDHHEENKGSKKSTRSPEYKSIGVRLSTFGKFPNNNAISIRDLAQAGFYYTGINDLVRCYWCDLGLKEWEYGDDPYQEHARHLPDCDHLRNVKGKDFIMHIQKETHHLAKRRSPSVSPRELLRADQHLDKGKASTNLLCTPAAQSVLETGYTDELVLAAIGRLNITDATKLTGIQIFEVILDAEEKGIDLTQNTQNNSGYKSEKHQNKKAQNSDEESQQLLAENQRLKSLMLCKHCQARERNILLLPCTHRSLCHECANKTKMCPECWKPIKERVRTYMA